MFKYTERFPHFGRINTLFTADYLEYNSKDVFEQILAQGWDCQQLDRLSPGLSPDASCLLPSMEGFQSTLG